jgi:hypothetical protein
MGAKRPDFERQWRGPESNRQLSYLALGGEV